jgi:hypothetical protein
MKLSCPDKTVGPELGGEFLNVSSQTPLPCEEVQAEESASVAFSVIDAPPEPP